MGTSVSRMRKRPEKRGLPRGGGGKKATALWAHVEMLVALPLLARGHGPSGSPGAAETHT